MGLHILFHQTLSVCALKSIRHRCDVVFTGTDGSSRSSVWTIAKFITHRNYTLGAGPGGGTLAVETGVGPVRGTGAALTGVGELVAGGALIGVGMGTAYGSGMSFADDFAKLRESLANSGGSAQLPKGYNDISSYKVKKSTELEKMIDGDFHTPGGIKSQILKDIGGDWEKAVGKNPSIAVSKDGYIALMARKGSGYYIPKDPINIYSY